MNYPIFRYKVYMLHNGLDLRALLLKQLQILPLGQKLNKWKVLLSKNDQVQPMVNHARKEIGVEGSY